MKHLLRTSILLILTGLITTLGAATVITTFGGITCAGGSAGVCSAQPGVFTVDFNGADPFLSDIATYAWGAGPFPVVQGSLGGAYAAPGQNDNPTPYLTVGSFDGPKMVTISLSRPIYYFGFYLGSPDTYNFISFYKGNTLIHTFAGDPDLVKPPDANPSSWDTANYVNFHVKGGTADRIVLESNTAAFETDNHAFLDTPEPSSLFLMGIGSILFAAGRVRILRRRKNS